MEKKTKLTISGGIAKKSIKNIDKAKNLGRNSVVIEKQTGKFSSRGGLLKCPLPGDFPYRFSIITVFFPCTFEESNFLKDFLGLPEIVSFVFFFSIFHPSIFINYFSCRHNKFICFVFR